MTNYTVDLLMSMYGRSRKYNDENWEYVGGCLNEPEFLKFKELADKTCPDYFTEFETLTLPSGGTMDMQHFWATLNGTIKGFPNVCGWAGDCVELGYEIDHEAASGFPSNGFSKEDWAADADAANIFAMDSGNCVSNMNRYFSGITEALRAYQFDENGGVSGRTWYDMDATFLTILKQKSHVSNSGYTAAVTSIGNYIIDKKNIKYNVKYTTEGYDVASGDILTVSSETIGVLSLNETYAITGGSSIIVNAVAGDNRTVVVSVNGKTVQLVDNQYDFIVTENVEINADYSDENPYNVYMTQTEDLYNLAKEAIDEIGESTSYLSVTNPDQLVSMYGRSKVYNSSSWDLIVGRLDGPQYNLFKTKADAKYPNYLDVKTLTLPDGYTLDVPHFWGTTNGQIIGDPNAIGWAGDLAQFAADYKANSGVTFPSGSFGIEDFVSDLDAYNIGNFGKNASGYVATMRNYFDTITHKERCIKFNSDGQTVRQKYDNNGYSSQGGDKGDVDSLFYHYLQGDGETEQQITYHVLDMMQEYIDKVKANE